jgi:phosphate transport system permease protein
VTVTGIEVRRRTRGPRRSDVFAAASAAAAAVAMTALLYGVLLPGAGPLGIVVTAYLLFLGVYAVLVSFDESGAAVRDRLAGTVIRTLAGVLLLALVLVVSFTVVRGLKALGHSNFLTQDMRNAGPLEPLSVGGVRHAMIGTLEQITIALAITVPVGIACAVYLSETPGRFAILVRTVVETMTALPSVVAGLFIYATVILGLGVEKSGFAAGLAISVMMLPIVIRTSDVVLRLVPSSLKEASYALGASQWRTVWHVVLPTARSGLTTAVILGTARGVGETSPVLLTAGFAAATNTDPLHGPQTSLPLATFQFVRSPQPSMIARGFGTGAVLLALVLVLFAVARILGGRQDRSTR